MDPEYKKVTVVVEDSTGVVTYVFYKTAGFNVDTTFEDAEEFNIRSDMLIYGPDRINRFVFSFKPIPSEPDGQYGIVTKKARPS